MVFYEPHNFKLSSPYAIIRPEDLTWGLHFHRAYECLLSLSGEIEATVGMNRYMLRRGDGLFLMTNQLHSYTTHEHSKILILRFTPELVGDFYSTYKEKIPVCNKFTYERVDLIEQIPAVFDNIYSLKGVLYDVCGSFSSQTEFVPLSASSSDTLIYDMINYIENHYAGECSLRNVSKELGYEYSYLSKYFSQQTGVSFVEYVNRSRLTMACHMLKNTDNSIIEIAQSCGFGSLRSFNRVFMGYCGCTPSQYKKA